MKRGNKKHDEELNFWQPTSDLMSGVMYILMLIIVLLGLYLMQIPEEHEIDPELGDSYEGGDWDGGGVTPMPTVTPWHDDDGGDGGRGVTPAPTWPPDWATFAPTWSPSPEPTISPTPDLPGTGGGSGGGTGGGGSDGDGPGQQTDVGMKSAVYVVMVDAETDRSIKEEGVEFELYNLDGALQILNTYYPERITYRSYLTTESGAFYFPEKLIEGVYQLHELTEPEGYDAANNVTFWLTQTYDWPDPLVVRVPLHPSRNIVRVQMTDIETGKSVSGGSFNVVAAENIITADGTLRYRAGQTAATIECDETGYGESEEIYLGNYTLVQKDIPPYYASYREEIPVEVTKKASVPPAVNTVENERTRIRIALADELYPTRGIQGAVLNVRAAGLDPITVTTDYSGQAVLEEIEKGVTYRVTQTLATGGYQMDPAEYPVTVTAAGRISGEAEASVSMTNRMIRVAVGLTDEMSSIQIPGVSMSLYNQAGELIRTWTTSGSAQTFNGLEPGSYYVLMRGEEEKRFDIQVRDTAELQTLNIHTTYTLRYVMFGSVGLAAAILVGAVVLLIRRRKKKKQPAEQEKQ